MLNRRVTDKHVQIAALLLIFTLGNFLRFYGLGIQSLWNDELASWWYGHADSLSTVINEVRSVIWPPGYHTLLYFVEQYVGDSETILRFPSAVSGVLSILAIFLVGRRLYSHKEGLIAAALMAVLWCPIYYSQEARAYAMLLLFTLLATYFWVAILESLDTKAQMPYHAILAYIATAIIASYLHYYGVYLVALQGLGAALFFFRKGRGLLYIFSIHALILLAYLPWLPTMTYQITHNSDTISWIRTPRPTAFLSYIRFLFNKSDWLVFLALALYAFLFLHGLYMAWKTRAYRSVKAFLLSPSLLLILWLTVPFAIVFVISRISTPILINRYLIISLPAAYLLLARAITQLPLRPKNQAIITFLLVVLLLYHLVFSMGYYSHPHKEQFREAVGYVVERNHLYENSLVIGYVVLPDFFDYYFERKGSSQRVSTIAGQEEDIPAVIKTINVENPKYVWYIRAHREPDPEFIDFLDQNLIMIDHKAFIRADVWLFENQ